MKKIHLIVGARPNIIKASPVYNSLKNLKKYIIKVINTGQHYDNIMMNIFIKELNFKLPDYNLQVGSGTHGVQTAKIIEKYEKILLKSKPDYVIVFGDVNSTLGCTIAAKKLMIKVIHIESGLRSFDKDMPEEINRIMVDSVADYCFTTCQDGSDNLINEGKPKKSIFMKGNTMIDSLIKFKKQFDDSSIVKDFQLYEKEYILFTLHRPSNVDNKRKLKLLTKEIEKIAKKYKCIFPVHPRTLKKIKEIKLDKNLKSNSNIMITNPLGYFDFMCLQKNAKVIVTDSGGVQEESTYFGVQCLTVRENTERPITITQGTNTLIGNSIKNISEEIEKIIHQPKKHRKIKYWDGNSGNRIAETIKSLL